MVSLHIPPNAVALYVCNNRAADPIVHLICLTQGPSMEIGNRDNDTDLLTIALQKL